jgi:hypothetical protein
MTISLIRTTSDQYQLGTSVARVLVLVLVVLPVSWWYRVVVLGSLVPLPLLQALLEVYQH